VISLKQGYPKKQVKIKDRIIAKQTECLLQADPWLLPVPPNVHYGTTEINNYFLATTLHSVSGEHAKKKYAQEYGFNLPDQQTVNVRVNKLSPAELESCNNSFSQQKLPALHYPNFMKRLVQKQNKQAKVTNQKRRRLKQRRKMQRDRGVIRPKGLYLALDEHNDPYYGEEEVALPSGENLASYLIRDRQKHSTKLFFSYITLYSFEQGLRQILGYHLMRRQQTTDGVWHTEPLGPVVQELLVPVRQNYKVAGVVGDGKYYNGGVIYFLNEMKLDFVIRADFTKDLKEWGKQDKLRTTLADGSGVWRDKETVLTSKGFPSAKLKLCLVRRGMDLVPLVVPEYSKLTPEQALLLYEERFGIETSYRELQRRMGQTTSHSPSYRVALFAAAVNVFNVMMQYYEQVKSGSANPNSWKTSLLDLQDALVGHLAHLMSLQENEL
jgi:hypothetical protein